MGKNKGIYYAFNDNDTTTSDVGAVPGPYGADEYDKSIVKYGRVMMESFPLLVTIKSNLMAEEDIKLHTKAKIIL